jgi:branched-subunit amino acid permease
MTSSNHMPSPPASGWSNIAVGFLLAVLGLVFAAVTGDDVGYLLGSILAAAGGLLSIIGTVAVGVTTGMRRSAYLDYLDELQRKANKA